MKYTIINNEYGKFLTREDDDGTIWHIPFDESNSDYIAYLLWINEGNEPLLWPADSEEV